MNKAETENVLREIWTKLLRLSNDESAEISDDTNFFEFGGTSLMIGIMNIMIYQKIGKNIDPEIFYTDATFGGIIKNLCCEGI